jgi:WD40 repeat protein
MRSGLGARITPFLMLGAVLASCREPNQPGLTEGSRPQFSQTAANGSAGKIAFHSNRDGNFQIYVMNPDGSDVVRLTFNSLDEFLPLWSPDGSRLTFGRCSDVCDVIVIDADGRNERTVLHDAFPGAWSPDGNRIAVGAPGGVYVVNVDGSGLTKISDLPSVRGWSPDGRQILLVGDLDGDAEIYAFNTDGSGTVQLTNNTASDAGETFSSDGSRIVYESDLDGPDEDVFVMNRDGSGVTDITRNDFLNEYGAVFSPDDSHFAFVSDRDGDEEIFVMNADGSGVVQITNNDGIADAGPSWVRQVPPVNDDFSGATAIAALPFGEVTKLTIASVESGEPVSSCASFYGPVSKTTWYAFTPGQTQSVTAKIVNAQISTVVAAYTGNAVANLTQVGCAVFGSNVTFRATAGTTYYFQVGGLFGQGAPVEFRLEVTPPPQANFGTSPFDPSIFDQVQFQDFSFDPVFIGFQPPQWSFGDGATGTGFFPTHRYAADADYVVVETVTTLDGRSASTSRTLPVRTHDVAITRLQAPTAGMTGKTSKISVDIRSNRYPETVDVQLFRSVPGGSSLLRSQRKRCRPATGLRRSRSATRSRRRRMRSSAR